MLVAVGRGARPQADKKNRRTRRRQNGREFSVAAEN
jgi:hypothetical protein